MTLTRSELQAWLDAYNGPDAQTIADFLGVELAPEPATPVGQRRRSPSGVEVIKGLSPHIWYLDADVADWEVIPDGTKCDREHLPSHSVRICLATVSDEFIADLARGAGSPIGPVADAAHRERERRRRLHDATTEEETA